MIISPLALLAPTLAMVMLGIDGVHSEPRTNTQGCVDPSKVSDCWDYFPEKVVPHYSENWDISYHRTYKILYNKAVGESYLMYQCGTTPPKSEEGKHNLTFPVPLQGGLAISSTTQIPQLEQLGLRRQIKGYIGNTDYISSPCLKTLTDQNITDKIFDDSSSYYSAVGSNITEYLEENPDLVIVHGYAPSSESSSNGNNIIVSEASEGGSRAIYEWHKVYASLFNLEREGNDQFEASTSRFECGETNAKYLSTTVLNEKTKPTVLWGGYSPYYNSWVVATCDPKYNYYCEFADTCFSTLLHSNENMNLTQFLEFGKTADVWIYTQYNWEDTYDKFKSELDGLASVQSEKVYDILGSGSGPWFEQRIAEYDVVVQDFCEVVGHTTEASQKHERAYFRKVLPLGIEDIGDAGTCDVSEIDLQLEVRASKCSYIDDNAEIAEPPTRLGPNDGGASCADPFTTTSPPTSSPVAPPVVVVTPMAAPVETPTIIVRPSPPTPQASPVASPIAKTVASDSHDSDDSSHDSHDSHDSSSERKMQTLIAIATFLSTLALS